ncbi:MAG: hypothetical protein FJ109_19890 [Deltaproteobacteria bacterium]|nr:hypothetical protein [Deltaproteobacteria bacterium]
MTTWGVTAMGLAAAAGIIGTADINDATVDSFGKWPITTALVGLAALAIYLSHKTVGSMSEKVGHLSDNIGKLAENLAQRPCVRSPKND